MPAQRHLAGAALACLLLVPSGAAAGERSSCRLEGSRTVLENRFGRILVKGTFEDRLGNRHRRHFGCLYSEGQMIRFGKRGSVQLILLGSDGVDFTERFSNAPGRTYVAVRTADLVAGGSGRIARYGGSGRAPRVTALASRGAVPLVLGWIVTDEPVGASPLYRVVRFDDCTSPETGVLDSGRDITPRRLTLSDGTLSWFNAGERRSATLYERDCPDRVSPSARPR